MTSKKIAFSILVLLVCREAFAQQEEPFEEALEQYAEQMDKEIEDDSRIWTLRSFYRHPLNLNTATKEDLKHFFFLNKLQIHAFLKYRAVLGTFINIYELQTIPYWDLKTIQRLLPYVGLDNLETHQSLRKVLKNAKLHLLLRYKRTLEKKRGYKPMDSLGNTHFLGKSAATYLRLQYNHSRHFKLGITMESDAGEPFSGYGQKGFDFYSFHFYLKDKGILKDLALGDYRINMGQGLINQQGMSFGKTGMVMNIDRSKRIIQPHTSAMENGFYRGAAFRLGKQKWSTTFFISQKSEDAFLRQIDSTNHYFRSFQTSGYHRSISELKNKGKEKLFSTGGNLKYDFGAGHIGLNAVYHNFSDSMGTSRQPYQLFHAKGYRMLNASMDYAFYWDRLYFFGETAVNKEGGWATINGLLMSVERNVDISLSYRDYAPQYTALYASAFGEGSHPQNERGFYMGIALRPATHWEIEMYSDFFKSPWLRYRVDMPSFGKEYFFQMNYVPSKKFRAYVRYRYKKKPINTLKDQPLSEVVKKQKQSLRLFMQWKISDYFRIRDQIDGTFYKKEKEKPEYGYMVYQNVRWNTNRSISGNFRIGYFHTDSYNSRVYTFENNVRYAFYVPSFYGEGLRSYINLRLNLGRRISLWARIARTWYFHQDKISSGWNEIEGNHKTKCTIELIWE